MIRRAENIMDEVCGNCLKRRGQHYSHGGSVYCPGKDNTFRGISMYCTQDGELYQESGRRVGSSKINPNISFKRRKVKR